MRWTIQQVAHALGVTAPAGLDPMARLAGVSIDSRSVAAGELFIAIHGPRHDGHAFVEQVLSAGAGAAVVASEKFLAYPASVREKLFAVPETLAALQQLAHEIRTDWGGRVAAVAGSVGKTTTKEILAALVAAKFRVLKAEGNLNNEYGLPLTLAAKKSPTSCWLPVRRLSPTESSNHRCSLPSMRAERSLLSTLSAKVCRPMPRARAAIHR